MTSETNKPVLSVLLLIADLTPGGAASPARLLAEFLPQARFRVTVAVLGETDEAVEWKLRVAGARVLSLPLRNGFDVSGGRRLRQAVGEVAPDVVHAWGPAAAWAARLTLAARAAGGQPPRLVFSDAASPGGGVTGWLTARLIRRADQVVAATRTDGERYRHLGVPSERLTLIPPAAPSFEEIPDREVVCRGLGLPPTAQILVNAGRSERGIGPKDAIVAFDMLRYDNTNLHLLVFGTGSESATFERFGRALSFDDFRIHFPPDADRTDAVQHCFAAMITRTRGGFSEALEVMAAGKPLVGWQTPELAELVENGVSGLLVPPGDRAALASKMHKLLDDPKLAHDLGEAAREWVTTHYSTGRMVEQHARLYEELVRVPPVRR